jgi:hypothetical protein
MTCIPNLDILIIDLYQTTVVQAYSLDEEKLTELARDLPGWLEKITNLFE